MSTILEQEQPSPRREISWEEIVEQIANGSSGPKVIRTKNHRTGFLRHGALSGAHFKILGILIAFEVVELHVARHSEGENKPMWVNAGDDCIEVEIPKGAPAPSVTPNGDIVFIIGDIDYRICP